MPRLTQPDIDGFPTGTAPSASSSVQGSQGPALLRESVGSPAATPVDSGGVSRRREGGFEHGAGTLSASLQFNDGMQEQASSPTHAHSALLTRPVDLTSYVRNHRSASPSQSTSSMAPSFADSSFSRGQNPGRLEGAVSWIREPIADLIAMASPRGPPPEAHRERGSYRAGTMETPGSGLEWGTPRQHMQGNGTAHHTGVPVHARDGAVPEYVQGRDSWIW